MMKMRFPLLWTLLAACAAHAEAVKLPDCTIPTGEQVTVQKLEFAPIAAQPGERIVFKAKLYYEGPKGSGWNTASSLTLNGKKLSRFTADRKERLLGRGPEALFAGNTAMPWWDKYSGLLIFFDVGGGTLDKRVAEKTRAEGHRYSIDVTDLVNQNSGNILEITNGMRAVGKAASLKRFVLSCKEMEFVLMPEAEVDKLRPQSAAPQAAAAPAAPAPSRDLRTRAELLPSGEMLLPELEIYPQASPTSGRVVFPALRRVSGKIPVLQADIFFHCPAPSGWNSATNIILNGRQISRYNAQGKERLLRRGTYMMTTSKREWWDKGIGLLVYFGPGTGEVDKRIVSPREEGYTYYLDVSDLLNYVELGLDDRIESDKENVLQLNNGLTSNPRNGALGRVPLTMKNARIVWMTAEEIEKIRPRQPLIAVKPTPAAATLTNGEFQVSATQTGGLVLERGGETYYFDAEFSYPNKPAMKFDRFGVGESGERTVWRPSVRKEGDRLVITAQSSDRKAERTVRFTGKLLEISDAVTNLTGQDLPLLSQYTALSTFEIVPDALYLAGMQGITEETGCGANPTLYIQGKKSGFGAMALEDAFRCHLELSRTGGNRAVLKNPTALAPGETYVQKQLVMLTGRADYFEFINTLRAHLKLNRTLNGPITLGGSRLPPEALQYRVAMAGTNPQWFEYGGVDSLRRPREEFVRQYQASRTQHHNAHPGSIILAYTENSPATVDRSKLEGGSLLPPNPEKSLSGTYGQPISKEATAVLDKTPGRDSILRTADGRAIIDLYYASGPDMLSLLVYAADGNHYEKVLFERTRFLLDQADVDGIYIDQYANGTMYPVERSRDRISYEKWDGRTVLLHPDGTLKSKLFDVGYAGRKTRADYIRFVTSRGKFFLANTQPVSTTEADAGGMRFYESDSENLAAMLLSTGKPPTYRLQAFAQLSPSPILLGCRPARFSMERKLWPKMYNRAFIGGLRHGLLYVHYGWASALQCYGLVNHMFPLTPVELGEGFIIGKERIVTAVSRKFITDVEPKKIIGFDAEGNDLSDPAKVRQIAPGKFEVDVKLQDWNSSCVIVLSGYVNAAEEQAELKKKVK